MLTITKIRETCSSGIWDSFGADTMFLHRVSEGIAIQLLGIVEWY